MVYRNTIRSMYVGEIAWSMQFKLDAAIISVSSSPKETQREKL